MRTAILGFLLLVCLAGCSGGADECSRDEDCAENEVCYLYMGHTYCVSDE